MSIVFYCLIYTFITFCCLFLFAAILQRYDDEKKNDDIKQLV